jgi:hypothetical protein
MAAAMTAAADANTDIQFDRRRFAGLSRGLRWFMTSRFPGFPSWLFDALAVVAQEFIGIALHRFVAIVAHGAGGAHAHAIAHNLRPLTNLRIAAGRT